MTGDDEAWQDYLDLPANDPSVQVCACAGGSLLDPECGGCCEAEERRREETNGVPGAIPSVPMTDDDTICANCRRRIPECIERGECGRKKGS